MQSILTSLLSSFHIGVPYLVYDATANLIVEMYGHNALDYFTGYVTSTGTTYFFIDDSPYADDFIWEFERIS